MMFNFDDCEFLEEMYVVDTSEFSIKSLVKELDKFICGQGNAKKQLALSVLTHNLILEHNKQNPKLRLSKSNILLTGGSGTGKTYMVQILAKILKKPLIMEDITHFSQTGYVGRDVTEIMDDLISECGLNDNDIDNAIVFLDEIDKIGERDWDSSVSTTGVQRGLLKIIEGTILQSKKHKGDTSNILFIFGGSFSQFFKNDSAEFEATSQSTLSVNKKKKRKQQINYEDLIDSGMLPELAGRIGNIIQLDDLSKKDLQNILLKAEESPLKQLKQIFSLRGQKLSLTKKEINGIIKESIKKGLGARGLKISLDDYVYKKYYK